MATVPYHLVESMLRVRGTSTTVVTVAGAAKPTVHDVEVELFHRRSAGEGAGRTLRLDHGGIELSGQLTADGRLQSIEHNAVGAGAAVVTAGATLLSFVGSIAQAAVRRGAFAGAKRSEGGETGSDPWADDHPDEAALLASNRTLSVEAASALATIRSGLLTAEDPTALRILQARERAVSGALDAARAEVGRIETLRSIWSAAQRTTHKATIECVVDVADIPAHVADTTPSAPAEGHESHPLWRDFGVYLEVVDARRANGHHGTHQPEIRESDEDTIVRWRIPREIELWVWKKSPAGPVLVSRGSVWIADERSDTFGVELRKSFFGAHGGSWTFNDDGSPSVLKTNDESSVGAFATALAGVPAIVAGAAGHASTLVSTLGTIRDAGAVREQAAAERALATVRARLELLGVHATAADFADLKRSEQAVSLQTANRSLHPATDAVAELKKQLDLATAQQQLDAVRRAADVETELADLTATVARLELQVTEAKALAELAKPR